jgi:hypothetical protein
MLKTPRARRSFPDPNDRTINDPAVIISSKKLLRFYNNENKLENGFKKNSVDTSVLNWGLDKTKDMNWDNGLILGNSLLLSVGKITSHDYDGSHEYRK